MKSEASANQSLAASVKQDRIEEQQHQVAAANQSQRQLKRDLNSIFWHRVVSFIAVVTVLAVAYRLFIIWWS